VLGLMGFSGSLPLCVTIIDIICMFINWATKDACLLTCDGVDVDECAINNGGCSALATCTDTPGSFTCTCLPGYTGNGFTCGGEQAGMFTISLS